MSGLMAPKVVSAETIVKTIVEVPAHYTSLYDNDLSIEENRENCQRNLSRFKVNLRKTQPVFAKLSKRLGQYQSVY